MCYNGHPLSYFKKIKVFVVPANGSISLNTGR